MEHKNRLGSRLQIRKIKSKFVFPTLFSRLVTVYISMLVIMLVIIFITFTNAFQAYFVKYTKSIMIKQATSIAEQYTSVVTYTTSEIEALRNVIYHIQVMNSYLDATTWLIDRAGNVVMIDEEGEVKESETNVTDDKQVNAVFDGMIIGIENGFKDYFTIPVLTIGYPITIGKSTDFALFIHTPMPFILQTIAEIRKSILAAVGIIGSLMFVWIYITSKRITRPLKEMNEVAKKIASGDFEKRIKVNGKDEVSELAESFNDMATELDKIEEKRRQFIANVSHDLRSPLTSIQGFVTAILDGTISPEKQEKYLKIVLSESQRMIKMSNAILELNKMQESKAPIQKTHFNIITMINRTLSSVEERIEQKKVHVETDFDIQHPIVNADMDGISRVVQNLVDNALKFIDEGGRLSVMTRYRQNKLWIAICNTGAVISEEQQKNIWDRFYKGDSSRGKDKAGAGLGLVIVKEIIKQHNEVVGVHSEEGEPVMFYFSLECIENKLN